MSAFDQVDVLNKSALIYIAAKNMGFEPDGCLLYTSTPQGLELQDVNRFPNHLIEVGGHYYWDIYELYRHILEGLKSHKQHYRPSYQLFLLFLQSHDREATFYLPTE